MFLSATAEAPAISNQSITGSLGISQIFYFHKFLGLFPWSLAVNQLSTTLAGDVRIFLDFRAVVLVETGVILVSISVHAAVF